MLQSPLSGIALALCCAGCSSPPSDAECDAIRAEWQQSYDDLMTDHAACNTSSDCQALNGPCVTNMGGCSVAVNVDLKQGDILAIERGFMDEMDAAGCTVLLNACDCQMEEFAECGASGTCERVPD